MAVDIQFVNALVAWGRLDPYNVTQMSIDFGNLYQKIAQNQGRQLSSVSSPGNSASWNQAMTIQEHFEALSRALSILTNNNRVWKRTCNRVFV